MCRVADSLELRVHCGTRILLGADYYSTYLPFITLVNIHSLPERTDSGPSVHSKRPARRREGERGMRGND
jgi:hypothetical protein